MGESRQKCSGSPWTELKWIHVAAAEVERYASGMDSPYWTQWSWTEMAQIQRCGCGLPSNEESWD